VTSLQGRPVPSASVTARLWTGKGDDGTTGLLYGGRTPKSSRQIEAVGSVDEAQAAIGVARAEARRGSKLDKVLVRVERELWVLMAELATGPRGRAKLVDGESRVTEEMVRALEADTDQIGSRLALSPEFVVPGQNRPSALLDVARTVVRRAERAAQTVPPKGSHVLPYLNRLSSLLWVLARQAEGTALPTRTAPRRTKARRPAPR
jgi:cob(I)alamin adenosyltransferase